ncbi:MAG: hypothetical protein ABL955_08280 [Elusimicrobiota bacterium]
MGKFFALVIMVFIVVWLAPMCAKLPDDLSTVAAPIPVEVVAPIVSTVTAPAPAPEPVAAPSKPAPPSERPPLTLITYRSRKMFPVENDKYLVSIIRGNPATVAAAGVRMILTSRLKGQIAERAESGPGKSLAAGSTSYFGLNVSTVVFDELLNAADEPGNELEWTVAYRFQDEAPTVKRCTVLRALPRRREPEGITWRSLGESRKCDTPAQ